MLYSFDKTQFQEDLDTWWDVCKSFFRPGGKLSGSAAGLMASLLIAAACWTPDVKRVSCDLGYTQVKSCYFFAV